MRKIMMLVALVLVMFSVHANIALANKAEASIQGPAEVAKGTEVTLKITSTHNANTASHYTEWLKVTANRKELNRWNYTKENLPGGAIFGREIKLIVTENTEIVAESSCNNHGSKGPAILKITVK